MSGEKSKLLMLGASRFIEPVIEAAHNMNCMVITCDDNPQNPGHAKGDEVVIADLIDLEAILRVAREKNVDGVLSFACDTGVVTAAYVAEELRLPYQTSFETACLMQSKDRFRSFLKDNGFNCPWFEYFEGEEQALRASSRLPYPVIVKPTDSAGSKGVCRVDYENQLANAVSRALTYSRSGCIVIEEYLEADGFASDADGFTVDGIFRCISYSDQMFDVDSPSPYTPTAFTMPSTMPVRQMNRLSDELQRLASLLELRTGIYNIETRVSVAGVPYIMEVTPRGGGNRLAEMLRFSAGVDLIKATVQGALGKPIEGVFMPSHKHIWHQVVLHSSRSGVFRGVRFDDEFEERHVVDVQLGVKKGAMISPLDAANATFGSVMLRFEDEREYGDYLTRPSDYVQLQID